MSLKNPVTPPGIDPGTVRLVAQCLNHYATPGPSFESKEMRNFLFGPMKKCGRQFSIQTDSTNLRTYGLDSSGRGLEPPLLCRRSALPCPPLPAPPLYTCTCARTHTPLSVAVFVIENSCTLSDMKIWNYFSVLVSFSFTALLSFLSTS